MKWCRGSTGAQALRSLSCSTSRSSSWPLAGTSRCLSQQSRHASSAAAGPPPGSVIFSGIQPTGVPHLGNYVGALRQWVQLQHSSDDKLIYSIVDLHAITMPQPPDQLRSRKREAMAALLAIGIDPDRATLFHQSAVRPGPAYVVSFIT